MRNVNVQAHETDQLAAPVLNEIRRRSESLPPRAGSFVVRDELLFAVGLRFQNLQYEVRGGIADPTSANMTVLNKDDGAFRIADIVHDHLALRSDDRRDKRSNRKIAFKHCWFSFMKSLSLL